jgi:hypothetical protein
MPSLPPGKSADSKHHTYLALQLHQGVLRWRLPAQLRPQPLDLGSQLALPCQPGLACRACLFQELRCLLDVLGHLERVVGR